MSQGEMEPKRKRGVGTGGRFFVLERGQFDRIFDAPDNASTSRPKMNLALAYLVALAGTGADGRLTKWSANAITNYTGMRHDLARAALTELMGPNLSLMARAKASSHDKPQYEVLPPRTPARGPVKEPRPVFLPVALVTGLNGEASMLRRVRETGDPLLLRLLVDLYSEVTTDAPHAVSISALRGYRKGDAAVKIIEMGVHAIFKLIAPDVTQAESLTRARYLAKGENPGEDFWARVTALERIGAIERQNWLCSSPDADADPIFPLNRELRDAADTAARALLEGPNEERVWMSAQIDGDLVVVLPAHCRPPAVLELFRMRVEADTPGRRAAYGRRARVEAHWVEEYVRLAREAAAGTYDRPLRTAPEKPGCRDQGAQGDQGDQGDQSLRGTMINRFN